VCIITLGVVCAVQKRKKKKATEPSNVSELQMADIHENDNQSGRGTIATPGGDGETVFKDENEVGILALPEGTLTSGIPTSNLPIPPKRDSSTPGVSLRTVVNKLTTGQSGEESSSNSYDDFYNKDKTGNPGESNSHENNVLDIIDDENDDIEVFGVPVRIQGI